MPHDLSLLNMTFQLPHFFPFYKASCRPAQLHDVPFHPATPNTIYPLICPIFISYLNTFYFFIEHLFSHGKSCTIFIPHDTLFIFFCSSRIFYAFFNKVSVTVHKRMVSDFHFSQSMGIVCLISATK